MIYKQLIFALSIFVSISVSAQNRSYSEVNSLASKTLEWKVSEDKIEIQVSQKGANAKLPVVKKVLADNYNSAAIAMVDAKASFNNMKIDENYIVQKERRELSRELGITIRNDKYMDLYREIVYWIGTPYRYGSMNKNAVDCSGFTKLIFETVYLMDLPRSSREMARQMKQNIEKEDLEPGDLVFFGTRGKYINHVGIYIGEDKFIHASRSRGVTVSSLNDGYYKRRWKKAIKMGV